MENNEPIPTSSNKQQDTPHKNVSMEDAMSQLSDLDNMTMETNITMSQNSSVTQAIPAPEVFDQLNGIPDSFELKLHDSSNQPREFNKHQFCGSMETLNMYVSEIYKEFQAIDESFNKVAQMFMDFALTYADEAAGKGKSNSTSSSDDIIVASTITASFVVKGFGNLIAAWEANKQISSYKQVCRKILRSKGPYINQMYRSAYLAAEDSWLHLEFLLNEEVRDEEITDYELFEKRRERIRTDLNNYRSSRFIYEQIRWLRDQMEAWSNNELENEMSPAPSVDIINKELLLHISNSSKLSSEEEQEQENKHTCTEIASALVKQSHDTNNLTWGLAMIISDKGLLASLLLNIDENETRPALYDLNLTSSSQSPNPIARTAAEMESLNNLASLEIEKVSLAERGETHEKYLLANAILGFLILEIPILFSGWTWWVILILSVVWGYFCANRLGNSFENVDDKISYKISMISKWQNTLIKKMTGYVPKPKSIRDVEKKRNNTGIGAVIGGAVGLLLGPLGAAAGAAIGSALGGIDWSSEEEDDGHDFNSCEIASVGTSKFWTVTLSLILLGVIILMFI